MHDGLLAPDPYPHLARLRETDPVHRSERHNAWMLLRYDGVASAFKDPRFSADRITPFLARLDPAERSRLDPVFGVLRDWMVFRDPPEHGRLRRLAPRRSPSAACRTCATRSRPSWTSCSTGCPARRT